MWIYTRTGMVSVVQHRDKSDKLLIRARSKSHLQDFINKVEGIKTFYLEDADYRYRALVKRAEFERMILAQAKKIDYPDFKSSIPKTPQGNKFYVACHIAWDAMNSAYKRILA